MFGRNVGILMTCRSVFILPEIFVTSLGTWCGQIYIKAQLSVKREMSNARSPVLAHFGAAMEGLGEYNFFSVDSLLTKVVSIRAYSAQPKFTKESLARIDMHTRASRTFLNLNRSALIPSSSLLRTEALLPRMFDLTLPRHVLDGFASASMLWVRYLQPALRLTSSTPGPSCLRLLPLVFL